MRNEKQHKRYGFFGCQALNLLEDGLATWLTALRVAPGPDPGLTGLFPLLAAAMHVTTGAPLQPLYRHMALHIRARGH